MRLFQDMLSNLVRGTMSLSALGRKHVSDLSSDPEKAMQAVLMATGEVSSLVYAENLLTIIEDLDDDGFAALFTTVLSGHDIDAEALTKAAKDYTIQPSDAGLKAIANIAEPGWIELFRRLNATTNGTVRLVRLRERLLKLIRQKPEVARIDVGLVGLLRNWFNPGFLVLEPIDWSTPANILEKIIAYEAVHEITSWDDLRARLAPEDRRCFAFFHPAMPDEPLIFVEVALTTEIPRRIDDVLALQRDASKANGATTAVFYSISNCQNGLAGISFGNFLIKRVARHLRSELPNLTRFVTLSPVPGLMKWLAVNHPDINKIFAGADRAFWQQEASEHEADFIRAALQYLTKSDRADGLPNDPVARFHLGNGAFLEQLNFGGDRSAKGVAQAGGLMVNYLYDLDVVEKNHEEFNKTKTVPVSPAVRAMMKAR
ncbi:MAG: malonyl-CoA decarboxylase family protein [Alphaproteobacteria bacterium]|jgi:malonyl-CoA decarboxylase